TDEVGRAANSIIDLTRTAEFARHAASAVPKGLEVPNESAHPNFLVVDFGICAEDDQPVPRLIELQAFPSLVGFQLLLLHLMRKPDLNLPFQFHDDLDVEWVGHPNWYFRISKHSLPFLKTEQTSPAFFADEFPAGERIDSYVLKPLYSFAGLGVDLEPTREKLSALKNRHEWILQRKIEYAEFVSTVEGEKSNAETRMIFVWPENDRDPVLVNNLVRMSQGKMMGVDFNVDKTWVGASIA